MSPMSDSGTQAEHEQPGNGRLIVVGVDGSADSIAALRAAAWAAGLRRARLVAVTAWTGATVDGTGGELMPDLQSAAETVLRDAIEEAFHGRPLVPVEAIVRAGTPTGVVVDESRDAELLVVGSRGGGGFSGLLLGSVSMAATMHAHCPVLVLHSGDALTPEQESPTGARVVVGVGGGRASSEVLRVAAQVAKEVEAELLAVAAWRYPGSMPERLAEYGRRLREAAQETLDARIADAFPDGPPSMLRTELREGSPAEVLVEASRTADLLVVGRRGHGELSALLLGSVSLPVAEHAACPVLVVPGVRVAPGRKASEPALVGSAD